MKQNVVQDRNAKVRYVVIVMAVAISLLILFGRSRSSMKPKPESQSIEEVSVDAALSTSDVEAVSATERAVMQNALGQNPTAADAALAPVTHEERASLDTLTSILCDETRGNTKPTELLNKLAQVGYQTLVAKDSNDYTGSMVVVRTKNALPGTRYF
ncbi:MAG: hypothetical protein AAB250_16790, partial [Bdellovibrionota bacterium]